MFHFKNPIEVFNSTSSGLNGAAWAPSVIHYKDLYYMVYCNENSLIFCYSDSPLGPFHYTSDVEINYNPLPSVSYTHLFLGDEAKFISEHIKQPLAPNTLVIIPKERFHQFHISGPDENYHRCVLNFVDIPQYEQLIKEVLCDVYLIPEITDETAQLFSKLCRTAESDSSEYERQILLYAVLAELLIEIKENLKLKRNTKVCEGTVNPFKMCIRDRLKYSS